VVVEVEWFVRLLAAAVQVFQGPLEAEEVELLPDCRKKSVDMRIKRSSINT
jgi:hypothetical protein